MLRLHQHGASDELITTTSRPLEDLDRRDDGYGDRHFDRVRNNMSVISQNLRAANRQEPPPERPTNY
jgi:hypothetical protein